MLQVIFSKILQQHFMKYKKIKINKLFNKYFKTSLCCLK